MSSSRLPWLIFVLLGACWGSSYLFIKIGVDGGLAPFTLIAIRLAVGVAVVATVFVASGQQVPRRARTYGHLFAIAILSVALPFSLITWAERSVDSTLAAVINGAIPLCVIVIAPFVLPEERLTPARAVGLVVGFAGVAVLVGFDPGVIAGSSLAAVAALIGSTFSYAAGGVYARRFLRDVTPVTTATFELGFAFAIVAVLALIFDAPFRVPANPAVLLAPVWLGVVGSGIAFMLFFRLLRDWGATRASMVAYLIPVFGLALGATVLGERIDARLIAGTLLVVAGIAIVNARLPLARPSRQRLAKRLAERPG
jgi:drug/metabolite transporter (DMT)-like permease